MGKLGILIAQNLHWIIVANMIWGVYGSFEAHQIKMEQKDNQINAATNKLTQEKKKITNLKDWQENLDNSKRRVEEVQKQIDQIQKQLPVSSNDTEILDNFAKESSAINIREVFLNPGKEEDKGFYFSKYYVFKGTGTWLQFLLFFEALAKKDRIYNIKKLEFNRSKTKQKGRFQMHDVEAEIEAFRYNPDYAVKVTKDEAPKK